MAMALTDPFDVALRELRDTHGVRRHELRRAQLGEAVSPDIDSRVPAGATVVVDVVLEAFDGGIEVAGTVSSRWEGECRRCLAGIDGEVTVEVREVFRPGGGPDEGTYPVHDGRLNLREMVTDALFAGLPVLPLCKSDCLGLCPRCGADRNHEPCQCQQVQVDDRWAGLRDLLGRPSV